MNINDTASPIKCVIIDDQKDACDRLENLLKKIPSIEVLAKETRADNAIETVIAQLPHLVFIDVEMPGKSGFDVVKEIRQQGIGPTFIFVTAYDQYAIKAIRNEAFDFLLKPVDIDELKAAVARYQKALQEKKKLLLPEKLKKQYSLTDREIEIIELLLEGKSSQQIAGQLFISRHTVDTHRRNILEKTNIASTAELMTVINKLHR